MTGALRRVGAVDEIGVLVALTTICLFPTISTDQFWSTNNLLVVTSRASYVGMLAVGMVFVIAMGDIDLSLGSTSTLASVCTAHLIRDGQGIRPATWSRSPLAPPAGRRTGSSAWGSGSRRSSSPWGR